MKQREGIRRAVVAGLGCVALAFPCALVFLLVPIWAGWAISAVVISAYAWATFDYVNGS